MKTKAELATAVGRRLRVVDALASLSAEDSSYIEDEYDMLLEQWKARTDGASVYWSNTGRNTEEIPEEVFQPLADILAAHCATGFGKDEPVVTDEVSGQQVAISVRGWRNLKRITRIPASGLPVKATYY